MKDKQLWKERNNQAWIQARAGSTAAGLAILVAFVDGIGANLSSLMEAQLKAIEDATEEINAELQSIKRRIR